MSQDTPTPPTDPAGRPAAGPRAAAAAGRLGKPARRRARALPSEERAAQIVDAARAVFVAKGFADARIDDVARRAGIAKGTVYLHFASKEELFKAIVRASILPAVGRVEQLMQASEAGTEDLLRAGLTVLVREILGSDRRHILRLLLTEGHRFPELARFYHEEVISRGFRLIRLVLERGRQRGEVRTDAFIRFPQLLLAPALLAVLWEGLFGFLDPIDVQAMLEAHLELVLAALRGGEA